MKRSNTDRSGPAPPLVPPSNMGAPTPNNPVIYQKPNPTSSQQQPPPNSSSSSGSLLVDRLNLPSPQINRTTSNTTTTTTPPPPPPPPIVNIKINVNSPTHSPVQQLRSSSRQPVDDDDDIICLDDEEDERPSRGAILTPISKSARTSSSAAAASAAEAEESNKSSPSSSNTSLVGSSSSSTAVVIRNFVWINGCALPMVSVPSKPFKLFDLIPSSEKYLSCFHLASRGKSITYNFSYLLDLDWTHKKMLKWHFNQVF